MLGVSSARGARGGKGGCDCELLVFKKNVEINKEVRDFMEKEAFVLEEYSKGFKRIRGQLR